jgi:hypothetical protein
VVGVKDKTFNDPVHPISASGGSSDSTPSYVDGVDNTTSAEFISLSL